MATRLAAVAAAFIPAGLAAQDGPTARAFCDPADRRNMCPGADCRCTEDVLEVRFEGSGGPTIEVDGEPGLPIEALVVLETRSAGVQGFSYGVRHDGRALSIESATTDGMDVTRFSRDSFMVTRFDDMFECESDPGPFCSNPQPASGFISAFVISLLHNVELPVGTHSLARATYRLEPAAADAGDTLLEFTGRLGNRNPPPISINVTVMGRSTQPRILVDGRITVSLSRKPFHRGDPDGDGRLSVADAISDLLFLFLAGPPPGCLESGDFDDNGRIDIADPILILRWLFLEGSAPATPGPPSVPCARDPPGPWLGCVTYAGC